MSLSISDSRASRDASGAHMPRWQEGFHRESDSNEDSSGSASGEDGAKGKGKKGKGKGKGLDGLEGKKGKGKKGEGKKGKGDHGASSGSDDGSEGEQSEDTPPKAAETAPAADAALQARLIEKLTKEARSAKKYRDHYETERNRLRDELKSVEAGAAAKLEKDVKERVEDAVADALRLERETARDKAEELERNEKRWKREKLRTEKELSKVGQQLDQARRYRDKYEAERNILREEASKYKKVASQSGVEEEMFSLGQQLKDLTKELTKCERSRDNAVNKAERLEDELKELKEEERDLRKEWKELRRNFTRLEADNERICKYRDKYEEEKLELKEECKGLKESVKEMEKELKVLGGGSSGVGGGKGEAWWAKKSGGGSSSGKSKAKSGAKGRKGEKDQPEEDKSVAGQLKQAQQDALESQRKYEELESKSKKVNDELARAKKYRDKYERERDKARKELEAKNSELSKHADAAKTVAVVKTEEADATAEALVEAQASVERLEAEVAELRAEAVEKGVLTRARNSLRDSGELADKAAAKAVAEDMVTPRTVTHAAEGASSTSAALAELRDELGEAQDELSAAETLIEKLKGDLSKAKKYRDKYEKERNELRGVVAEMEEEEAGAKSSKTGKKVTNKEYTALRAEYDSVVEQVQELVNTEVSQGLEMERLSGELAAAVGQRDAILHLESKFAAAVSELEAVEDILSGKAEMVLKGLDPGAGSPGGSSPGSQKAGAGGSPGGTGAGQYVEGGARGLVDGMKKQMSRIKRKRMNDLHNQRMLLETKDKEIAHAKQSVEMLKKEVVQAKMAATDAFDVISLARGHMMIQAAEVASQSEKIDFLRTAVSAVFGVVEDNLTRRNSTEKVLQRLGKRLTSTLAKRGDIPTNEMDVADLFSEEGGSDGSSDEDGGAAIGTKDVGGTSSTGTASGKKGATGSKSAAAAAKKKNDPVEMLKRSLKKVFDASVEQQIQTLELSVAAAEEQAKIQVESEYDAGDKEGLAAAKAAQVKSARDLAALLKNSFGRDAGRLQTAKSAGSGAGKGADGDEKETRTGLANLGLAGAITADERKEIAARKAHDHAEAHVEEVGDKKHEHDDTVTEGLKRVRNSLLAHDPVQWAVIKKAPDGAGQFGGHGAELGKATDGSAETQVAGLARRSLNLMFPGGFGGGVQDSSAASGGDVDMGGGELTANDSTAGIAVTAVSGGGSTRGSRPGDGGSSPGSMLSRARKSIAAATSRVAGSITLGLNK